MIPMPKNASACEDCGLCAFGQNSAESNAVDRIAREVARQIRGGDGEGIPISVGVSARHAHVDDETLEILFGPRHALTPYRKLYQPGAFAAEEVISVVGPRLRAMSACVSWAPAAPTIRSNSPEQTRFFSALTRPCAIRAISQMPSPSRLSAPRARSRSMRPFARRATFTCAQRT